MNLHDVLITLTILGALGGLIGTVASTAVWALDKLQPLPTEAELMRQEAAQAYRTMARIMTEDLYGDGAMGDEGRDIEKTEPTAEASRDEALALVTEHNAEWMGNALEIIETLPSDFKGIGEDINNLVRAKIGEPHSPNAYGALISRAKKKNLIRWTGEMAPMRGLRSNARMSFVYVKGEGLAEAAE